MASGSFLIFGHRGSPRVERENSMASFRAALNSGADGFETDLRMLADEQAVLFHDDTWGGRTIEELTASKLRMLEPSLLHLADLAELSQETRMILEVKRHGWEQRLCDLVGGWPGVVVSSFDHRVLRVVRSISGTIETGAVIEGYFVDFASYLSSLGAGWAFPQFRFVDREMVDSLHSEGIRVVPWTANDETQWEALRRLGCDGVITDFPAEAVRWRD